MICVTHLTVAEFLMAIYSILWQQFDTNLGRFVLVSMSWEIGLISSWCGGFFAGVTGVRLRNGMLIQYFSKKKPHFQITKSNSTHILILPNQKVQTWLNNCNKRTFAYKLIIHGSKRFVKLNWKLVGVK